MTTVEKFMRDLFDQLVLKFPSATILYQHNELSDTHFFKVTPVSVYDSDAFINFSLDADEEFCQAELEGMLCFLTENSLVELDEPTRKHLPLREVELLDTVELYEENIGQLNVFIQGEGVAVRSMEYTSFSNMDLPDVEYRRSSFAMAA